MKVLAVTAALMLLGCSPDAADPGAGVKKDEPSIHALMKGVLAPASDAIWQGVAENYEGEKTTIQAPQDDAGWRKLANEAERLEDAAHALVKPGLAVVAPGELIQDAGNPSAPQADAIAKRISAGQAGFSQHAGQMGDVTRRLRAAIAARDSAKILDLGGALNESCSNCHEKYWYPRAN